MSHLQSSDSVNEAELTALTAAALAQGLYLGESSTPGHYNLASPRCDTAILGGAFSLDEVRRYLRGEEI